MDVHKNARLTPKGRGEMVDGRWRRVTRRAWWRALSAAMVPVSSCCIRRRYNPLHIGRRNRGKTARWARSSGIWNSGSQTPQCSKLYAHHSNSPWG